MKRNANLGHVYKRDFFDYIDIGSQRSAAKIVAITARMLRPSSVLDVGCGRGVWVAEWLRNGSMDSMGLDGDYVLQEQLVIPGQYFRAIDLSQPFDLGRRFDLVQSLEVAEHIDSIKADVFVDNLCRHSDLIVFSAAVPGQGGEMHVNEQPLEYWRRKFCDRGYLPFDCIRPKIEDDRSIEPWYRYNCLIYAKESMFRSLPADVYASRLLPEIQIRDLAPLSWRMRNALLRWLPFPAVNWLASMKHHTYNLSRRV